MTSLTRALTAALLASLAIAVSGTAQATVTNGSFENNYDGWTATGDIYLVTDNGTSRTRHDYLAYQGWEGADVWFGAGPADGGNYLVVGSNGNESDGSVTSALWTATKQFLSFSQAGNDTTQDPGTQAFAQILSSTGDVLGTIATPSYNDSLWRSYTFDLAALGLSYGDTFQFYYQDGASWSVLDAIGETGPDLVASTETNEVPEPGTLALAGLGVLMLGLRRRAK